MEGEPSARADRRRAMKYRNTASLIETADRHFDAALYRGIMTVYAHPAEGRAVRLTYEDRNVVDFVRCSYLGLDNHPDIIAGAAEAVRNSGALHWSCAHTA